MSDEAPYSIDFAKLRTEASAMADTLDTDTPVVESAPEAAPAAAAVETAPTVGEVAPSANVPVEELDPEAHGDRLVKVKVNGEWQTQPLKEVIAGYSRTSDYTRKAQDLARQRGEIEANKAQFEQSNQQLAYIKGLLNNKTQVQQFIQQAYPELLQVAQQPIQGDPNEIATIQQARQLVEQQAQSYQQQLREMATNLQAAQTKAIADLEFQREFNQHSATINHTLTDILAANPVLNKIPSVGDILRSEVLKLKPTTVEETNEAFRTVAKGIVEDLNSSYSSVPPTSVKAPSAPALTKARIEPPGGTGPQPIPTKFTKNSGRGIDWKALYKAGEQAE